LAVGDTDIPDPLLAVPTVPTPLLIDPLVALVEEKVSIVLFPDVMVAGVAVRVAVGAEAVLPLFEEDEPPQLASSSASATSNAVEGHCLHLRPKWRFPLEVKLIFFPIGFESYRLPVYQLGESNRYSIRIIPFMVRE
jgi:hypothetical protein